ncbi:MAG: hypothetical protein ACREBG_03585 [Pyrinomonadaceae bacterium]
MSSYLSRFVFGLTLPGVAVFAINGLVAAANGLYAGLEVETPASLAIGGTLSLFCAVAWWMRQDSQKRKFSWPFDMGMFLYIAWPLVLPYYMLKTRGVKALLAVGAFVGLYAVASMAGVALGFALSDRPMPS